MNGRLVASVYGRVQMVMFRDFVTRKARGLGLYGKVRNMKDGSVFVIAEGNTLQFEKLLGLLEKGPMLSKVEHIEHAMMEPSGEFTSFHIEYE